MKIIIDKNGIVVLKIIITNIMININDKLFKCL